ncbi:hypothetical protein N0V85_003265 [Neurospora sp. IMI 360204]|nr:hypothetical protein N0V85_003265 [Neurospora sp. IMI 360204]
MSSGRTEYSPPEGMTTYSSSNPQRFPVNHVAHHVEYVEYVEYLNSQVSPLTRIEQQRGSPFVPDPNDDAKTPKDEKWWELAHGEFKEIGGMNPFREWEGDHQQKETQNQHDTNTGQVFRQNTAKGGPLQRGIAPPHLLTGLLPKTYDTSEAGENDIFNGASYSKEEEYTPSVYTPSEKSPSTPTPEMFPKAPTGTTSESPPAKSTTAAPETLLTRDIQHAHATDSDNEPSPPPGGRYFDVDEEYTPSGTGTSKSFVSGKPPSLDFSNQTQTLHSELLKLAHKQQQQQQQEQQRGRGSGQSGQSGESGQSGTLLHLLQGRTRLI